MPTEPAINVREYTRQQLIEKLMEKVMDKADTEGALHNLHRISTVFLINLAQVLLHHLELYDRDRRIGAKTPPEPADPCTNQDQSRVHRWFVNELLTPIQASALAVSDQSVWWEEQEWLTGKLLEMVIEHVRSPIDGNLLCSQIHDTERVLGVKMMTDEVPFNPDEED